MILSAWQETKKTTRIEMHRTAGSGVFFGSSACHDANIRSNRRRQPGAASM
jgi:hypothetical protein